jgi:uncharacterized protein
MYIPEYPEAGSTLVYNTFSGEFVSLDAATLAVLRKADAGVELDASEREVIDPDFFDESVGILTESRGAEERAWREYHERSRHDARELRCLISTTFACNLDCTYCCQADVLNGKTMPAALGALSAQWVADRAHAVGSEHVRLDFIGGEPLLTIGRIEQIVGDVRARLEGTGIGLTFGLITNGVFLTEDLVLRWKPLGLVWAKVTLDGDETSHSITRRSKKKGEDTFTTIFTNVVRAAEHIDIYLNGNYQLNTLHGFVPLLYKLRDAGMKPRTKIHFTPALEALGAPTDAGSGACMWSGSAPEAMLPITDEVRRAGFVPSDISRVGPCAFHQAHAYSIDPEGYLYKCPGFFGKPAWAVGHVRDGLGDEYRRQLGVHPERHCGSCAHRPDCAGGCVAAEWTKSGRMEGVNCEIGFFDAVKPEIVKRMYLERTTDSRDELLASLPPVPEKFKQTFDLVMRRGAAVSLRVVAA